MKSPPNLSLLSLLILAALSIGFWGSSISTRHPFFSLQNLGCVSEAAASGAVDELGAALREAATAERTVIIAVVNGAYSGPNGDAAEAPAMLDLFLESFRVGEGTRGLLGHLLVAAVDRTAYDRCRSRRLHCVRLDGEGVDFEAEKMYMSEDFIKMMWRRTAFLGEVLRRGYGFIFTDTDVLWLRNPFRRLSSDAGVDLQISTDNFSRESYQSNRYWINTGFYFVRSNPRTVALFRLWHASRDRFPGQKEQDVLVELIREGALPALGLRLGFLDTLLFSGFCQDSRDVAAVVTVHANCCRTISAKVADLRSVLRSWKRWRRLRQRRLRAAGAGGGAAAVGGSVGAEVVPWYGDHDACFSSWVGVNGTRN